MSLKEIMNEYYKEHIKEGNFFNRDIYMWLVVFYAATLKDYELKEYVKGEHITMQSEASGITQILFFKEPGVYVQTPGSKYELFNNIGNYAMCSYWFY